MFHKQFRDNFDREKETNDFKVLRDLQLKYRFIFSNQFTWYIAIHYRTFLFLCGVMTFSYHVMFIHSELIWGKLIVSNAPKPLRICLDHILSSADKQRRCWELVLWKTKSAVRFRLEDKHVVNKHHVIWKSQDATQEKMSSRGTL